MRRLRRDSIDPLRLAAELIVTRSEVESWRAEDSEERERDRRLLAAISKPPSGAIAELQRKMDEIEEVVGRLDHAVAPVRRLARWALGISATVLVAVGAFLYARGFGEGGDAARRDRMERDIQELFQLQRQSATRGPAWPVASKGIEP